MPDTTYMTLMEQRKCSVSYEYKKTEKYIVYINEIIQNVSNESRLNVLVIHGDHIILEVFELQTFLMIIISRVILHTT